MESSTKEHIVEDVRAKTSVEKIEENSIEEVGKSVRHARYQHTQKKTSQKLTQFVQGCNVCEKDFKHVNTDGAFQSSLMFTDRYILKVHKTTYVNEKCYQSFKQEQLLKRHQNTGTETYTMISKHVSEVSKDEEHKSYFGNVD